MSSENQLFVTDEEDKLAEEHIAEEPPAVPQETHDDEAVEEGDDPVIQEFALNIAGRDELLHVLQYANKAKKIGNRTADHPFIGACRYKPNSSVWELDIPVDDGAFFNKQRAEDNWGKADVQTLRGVGVENSGQYAGFVSNGEVYLVPVEKVAQLRPFFKYIDKASSDRKQEDAKRNVNPASQKSQVVTMSVKSVNDPTQHRLAGALLAHKVAEEEEPTELAWAENTFEHFKESVVAEANSHVLKPLGDEKNYEENLV
ncbi:hypothetical protein HG536_0F01310 [Torulaspora globosa]|uniref:DNA-directed RNA polymerase III subunit RPC5 n=1 Tax=Torulaspora globosa TaxID=48254 RepID=A0A7G3ZJX0_9SACH|nr:uncharacterized protein HG536_0F01310 [Torulaspora globosa]QLL33806.1 hypothetical protein HG536_0F01310 [Torulaspora globosa]